MNPDSLIIAWETYLKSVPLDLILLFDQKTSSKSVLSLSSHHCHCLGQFRSPEWGDALVEGVEGDPVHVPDPELPLVPGHHLALELSVDPGGALLVTHRHLALGAQVGVFWELRRIIITSSLRLIIIIIITIITTWRQERQRGGVSWLGPMATASSLKMSSPGAMSRAAMTHLPTPSLLVTRKGRHPAPSSCRVWCWSLQKLRGNTFC